MRSHTQRDAKAGGVGAVLDAAATHIAFAVVVGMLTGTFTWLAWDGQFMELHDELQNVQRELQQCKQQADITERKDSR